MSALSLANVCDFSKILKFQNFLVGLIKKNSIPWRKSRHCELSNAVIMV